MNIFEIVTMLNSCVSREQGEAILDNFCRKNSDYQDILEYLNISSRGNRYSLKNRIIENTISYRLRSFAIQNYGIQNYE